MFILQAEKTKLTMTQREQMTSGSVNVYAVQFEFSGEWVGLEKTAVFKTDQESRAVALDDTGQCVIPWEVLTEHGVQLTAGVYGTLGGDVVLPTIWCNLGIIMEGTEIAGDEEQFPPTPELWKQELEKKQNKLRGTPGQIVGFDENGNAVAQDATSSGLSIDDIGHGLSLQDGKLTVVTTDNFKGDNTLPMTAAGVETVVGNIDILLKTI